MTTQDCNIAVLLGKAILVLGILAMVWMWVAAAKGDECAVEAAELRLIAEEPALRPVPDAPEPPDPWRFADGGPQADLVCAAKTANGILTGDAPCDD